MKDGAETFKVKVIYETRQLYGKVEGEREITIARD